MYIHVHNMYMKGTSMYNNIISVQPEIFARRKFSPILPPAFIGKNFIP